MKAVKPKKNLGQHFLTDLDFSLALQLSYVINIFFAKIRLFFEKQPIEYIFF